MKYAVSILFCLTASIFCFSQEENFQSKFAITQNENQFTVDSSHTDISLAKAPFTLSFSLPEDNENSDYAVKFAVTEKLTEVSEIQVGTPVDSVSFFGPGMCIAIPDSPYDYFNLTNNLGGYVFLSHDFFMDNVKSTGKTSNLIRSKDGVSRFENTFNEYGRVGRSHRWIKMSDIDVEEWYMILFCDGNLNRIIDTTEYAIIKVNFLSK
jgi:hypothetical protein